MQKRGLKNYLIDGILGLGAIGLGISGGIYLTNKYIDLSIGEIGREINYMIDSGNLPRTTEREPVEKGLEKIEKNNESHNEEFSQFLHFPNRKPWDKRLERILYTIEC